MARLREDGVRSGSSDFFVEQEPKKTLTPRRKQNRVQLAFSIELFNVIKAPHAHIRNKNLRNGPPRSRTLKHYFVLFSIVRHVNNFKTHTFLRQQVGCRYAIGTVVFGIDENIGLLRMLRKRLHDYNAYSCRPLFFKSRQMFVKFHNACVRVVLNAFWLAAVFVIS